MNIKLGIQRACRTLDRLTWLMAMICLAVMSGLVIVEFFARYAFNHSTTWIEELTRYLMVWMTMVGASSCLYRGELIGVDFLLQRLPRAAGRLITKVALGLIAAFLLTVLYHGSRLVERSFVLEAPASQIPMAWFYLAIPVGAGLMLVQSFGLLAAPPNRVNQAVIVPSE